MHLPIAPLVQAKVIASAPGSGSPFALHEPWTGIAAARPSGSGEQ